MELQLHGNAGSVQVSDGAFAREFNEGLVHQVVTAYLAGARQGTKGQKSRSDVSGGGIKPWRQKGTGRARSGTIRSPIWTGGGKTFAARVQDHSQKVNKKVYRAAMRAILSELVRQERLVLVETFAVDAPRTRELTGKLAALGVSEDVLIVAESPDDNLYLAARNLSRTAVCDASAVDPVSLIRHDKVVMTVAAVRQIEEKLG